MKLLSIIGVILGAAALTLAGYLFLSTGAGAFVRFQQTSTRSQQTQTTGQATSTPKSTTDGATLTRKTLATATDPDVALGSPIKLQLKTKDGKVAVELQVQAMYYFTATGSKTLIGGFLQNVQADATSLKALADALNGATLPDKDSEAGIDAFENVVRERIAASYDLTNFEDQLKLFLLASTKLHGSSVDVTLAEQYNFMIAPNFAGAVTDTAQKEALTKFVFGVIGRISSPNTR